MTNQAWHDDPSTCSSRSSRYKFVAKMLADREHVLEVGCADAFGTRLVLQAVKRLTATDFDPTFVEDVLERMDERWSFECLQHDLLEGPSPAATTRAYALDVIEHIPQEQELRFMGNIVQSLTPHGVADPRLAVARVAGLRVAPRARRATSTARTREACAA